MAHVSDIFSGGSSAFARLAAARGTLVTRFEQYRSYRHTLAELRNLSDRELNDLGLGRGGLKGIALEAVYK